MARAPQRYLLPFPRAHLPLHVRRYVHPQWHYGNGPDQPPPSIHWSGDGLRQGETIANAFSNIFATRLYRAFTKILNGRGILLAIADDVMICAPPSDLAEIVDRLPALAMSETGLTTQASKNRVYVQP